MLRTTRVGNRSKLSMARRNYMSSQHSPSKIREDAR